MCAFSIRVAELFCENMSLFSLFFTFRFISRVDGIFSIPRLNRCYRHFKSSTFVLDCGLCMPMVIVDGWWWIWSILFIGEILNCGSIQALDHQSFKAFFDFIHERAALSKKKLRIFFFALLFHCWILNDDLLNSLIESLDEYAIKK